MTSPPQQNPQPYLPAIPADARYAPPGSFDAQSLPPVPGPGLSTALPSTNPVRRVVAFNPQPSPQPLPPVPSDTVYRTPLSPGPAQRAQIAQPPAPKFVATPISAPASNAKTQATLQPAATPGLKPITQPPVKRVFCPAAIDLMDESITLFFRMPPSILATYYAACLPFFIAFIFFWHDMRTGLNSNHRILFEAIVLTVLYSLMKAGQAAFCSRVYHRLSGSEDLPWSVGRILHVALLQTIHAGPFFIIYFIAFCISIPFPWVNSFYHNIGLTASESKATVSSSFGEAAKLALLWPGKNFFGFIYQFILAFTLLVNLLITALIAPLLLKYFLNIDSSFAENPLIFFNSSAFLLVLIVCFLIINPINKIYHVLRCFYGRSRSSGVDLLAALRIRKSLGGAVIILLVAVTVLSLGSARADSEDNSPPPAGRPTADDPAAAPKPETQTPDPAPETDFHLSEKGKDLNQAIDKTLSGGGGDYSWRTADSTEDPLLRFLISVQKFFQSILDGINDLFKDLDKQKTTQGEPMDLGGTLPYVKVILIIVLVIAFLVLVGALVSVIMRLRKNRILPALPVAAPTRIVDLNEENVTADALPEDSWLALARELISKGELRLALRAFYLASLSTMASRQWVMLARGKSNRDYLREFSRRLHTKEAPVTYFSETMDLFEAAWYGDHSVTSSVLDQAEQNHQRLKQHAA